jgi:hypothetical protein
MLTNPAAAQETLPDPTGITLPDMSGNDDPKVMKNGYKFFYFHNSAVSFAEAHADLTECRSHLVAGAFLPMPGFVPWVETNKRKIVTGPSQFGLVGAVISSIIAPKAERGIRNNKMRRCMGVRGYVRYAVKEASWDVLNEGEEPKLIAMQAKLATGPKPDAKEVTE